MGRASTILLGAMVAWALAAGCGQKHPPFLSEVRDVPQDLPAIEEELPTTVPIGQQPVEPEQAPSVADAGERAADEVPSPAGPEVAPAPATVPTTVPAPTTAPATMPAPTSQATSDLATAFLRELGDIASGGLGGEAGSLPEPGSTEQRTLAAVLQGISDFRDRMKSKSVREAVPALLDMADRIRPVAPLAISNLAMCSKVDGFGNYEVVEARFASGREFSIAIYCELTGFSSRIGERAMWETRLSQEITLVDSSGQVVWKDGPSPVVDTCRNRRRDFFVARVIRLPGTLPPGKYVLHSRIVDQISREAAAGALEMALVGEK